MRLSQVLTQCFGVQTLMEASQVLLDSVMGGERTGHETELQSLVSSLQIRVQRKADVPFEGRYTWSSEGEEITLTNATSPKRQRFTLAHELGHCVARRFAAEQPNSGERFRGTAIPDADRQDEELVANALAAEILMPARRVYDELRFSTVGWEAVSRIVRAFRVSRGAAIRRISEVAETDLVYVTLIPRRLKNLDSPVAVDDFLLARPGMQVITGREGVRLTRRVPFSDFQRSPNSRLVIATGNLRVSGQFDARCYLEPMPIVRLIGAVTVPDVGAVDP